MFITSRPTLGSKISEPWATPSAKTCHPLSPSRLKSHGGWFRGEFPEGPMLKMLESKQSWKTAPKTTFEVLGLNKEFANHRFLPWQAPNSEWPLQTWKQLFPGTQMLPRFSRLFWPISAISPVLSPQSDPTLWSKKRWQPLRASGTAQRKRASNCYQGLQVHRNRLLIIHVQVHRPTRTRKIDTPPKFHIAPENRLLGDYFPFGKVTFHGPC